ncbi:MAG: sigma-70 family RNA polymerase sigma factor [Myxococcales bacterium]|nr:sigma-70 family RNA polymerase sigma factor [Myxococcales bacterium]
MLPAVQELSVSLLGRVAAGDPTAVKECAERFGGLVWSLARRGSVSTEDAEDATQEIFLDLWRSAARYDAAVGSEVTFVAMIARRRLIDRRRRRQRAPRAVPFVHDPPEAGPTPELGAEAALAARALDQLRPEQRQVLILTACHGLSHEEVATSTGMPLGTVKAHARRGLMRVREVLGEGVAAGAPQPVGVVS